MKKTIRNLAAALLGILCYFVILCLIIPRFHAGFFIGLAFTLAAAACHCLLSLQASSGNIRDFFLGWPSIYVGNAYLVVQMIVGAVFSIIPMGWRLPLILEILAFALFGSLILYLMNAGDNAKEVEDSYRAKTADMKALASQAKQILDATADYAWRKKVKAVYESILYAKAETVPANARLEAAISEELEHIRQSVRENDDARFEAAQREILKLLGMRQ